MSIYSNRPSGALLRMAVAFSFVFFAACGESLSTDVLLTRAAEALAEGRDDAALIDVRAAQQQEPDSREARRLLAEIELWRQSPEVAFEEVERAMDGAEPYPELLKTYARILVATKRFSDFDVLIGEGTFSSVSDDPKYLAYLSRAQAAWGEADAARATVTKAFAQAGSDPDVVTAYALVTIGGDTSMRDALDQLRTSADANPLAHELWSTLGFLYSRLGDTDSAVEVITRALEVNPYRINDRYRLATALIREERYDEAKEVLDLTESLAPSSPRVAFVRARWYIAQDMYEDALESINLVLAQAPRYPQALLLAGIANSALGNLETARRQWLTLKQTGEYQPYSRYRLADVLARLGEYEDAEVELRDILEDDPMNLGATRLLAAVLAAQGMHAESAQLYEQVLVADPDSASSLMQYSAELTRTGDTARAIELMREAYAQEPESAETLARLVGLLLAEGEQDEAEEAVNGFLERYPDRAVAHALVGGVAQTKGDPSAEQHFSRALELDPHNRMANSGLAELALAKGDLDAALARYEATLAGHEDDLQSLMRIAAVQGSKKDFAEMEATLLRAIEAHPNAAQPRVSLARFYVGSNRPNDTVRLLSTFEGEGSNNATMQLLLGGSYMALGETNSAVAAAKRIQKLQPTSSDGFVLEARALGRAGKLGAATDALREALKVNNAPAIVSELITALLLDGKPEEAREVLEAAPAGSFSEASYALLDGQIEAGANRLVEASSAFNKAYELEPREQTALLSAKTLWRAGNQDEAISVLNDWLGRDQNSIEALRMLSGYLLVEGRSAEALPYLTRMNNLVPGNSAILNNLAWASIDADPEQSLTWATEARALAPEDTNVKDTYSIALAANGEAEMALQMNDELIAQNPSDSGLVVSRARILAAAGDKSQAIQLLDSLLARGGDVPGAQALRDSLSL